MFVNLPGRGFVGVGLVEETSKPVTEFKVTLADGQQVPILEAPLEATQMGHYAGDLDRCEYVVRVKWLKTNPDSEAIWEPGMFANQNTACRLQGEKGEFTIERLTERFKLADDGQE